MNCTARLFDTSCLLFGREQHLDAGQDKKDGEEIEHPGELGDDCGACSNHDAAKNEHAQDAVNEHAVLVGCRNGEVGEDHRDDEDVVHRKALFDHEAGQIFHGRLRPHPPVDDAAEAQADGDVEGREAERLRRRRWHGSCGAERQGQRRGAS
jgi:hypothetical protein